MIVIKVVNQQLVQVAFAAGQHPSRQLMSAVLASSNKQLVNSIFARTLIQSSTKSQKVSSLGVQPSIIISFDYPTY